MGTDLGEEKMSGREYLGSCFCGAVELRVSGRPAAMGFCHCASCRQWSAAPVNGFILWEPTAVTIARGANLIGSYAKTQRSVRKWCTRCGGHLFTEHPHWGLVDVYAAMLPAFPFDPRLHVNYAEHTLRLADGLPKMYDLPAEMGGSGRTMAE